MNIRYQRFTLIELLVVLVVIAILAGLTIGGANFASEKSQESAIRMELKTLEMALEEYKKDWGYYPIWTDKKLLDGSGSGSAVVITLSNTPVPVAEFEKDTRYTVTDPNGKVRFSDRIGDPLYGKQKGDAWMFDFDLKKPPSMGETAYLQNRSSTPFTQLKGPRAIRYRYPGVKNQEKYDIIFAGHDEKFGTSDDINNWTEH